MADKLLSQNSELGHSFLNAMWIAGFLAAVQIVAVGMAIVKRSPGISQPNSIPSVDVGMQGNYPVPSGTKSSPPHQAGITPVHPKPPVPLSAPQTASDLSEVLDPVGEIKDPLVKRLVESGVNSRSQGNLKRSLEVFLDAEKNLADHPRILAEIAGTYGQLGQQVQAKEYWGKVAELGPLAAGEFYEIAVRGARGEPPLPTMKDGKDLKIGKTRLRKQPPAQDGEWVYLTVPIQAAPSIQPMGNDMVLRVYFYDLVNGKKLDQTTADVVYEYPTKPYNWQENRVEEIQVIYHQPVFTVEQTRNLGQRIYFGYVIELYYQDELQDSIVSSDELRGLRFQRPEPVVQPAKAPQSPDSSLFPINR